jgi:hypothetical protein
MQPKTTTSLPTGAQLLAALDRQIGRLERAAAVHRAAIDELAARRPFCPERVPTAHQPLTRAQCDEALVFERNELGAFVARLTALRVRREELAAAARPAVTQSAEARAAVHEAWSEGSQERGFGERVCFIGRRGQRGVCAVA